MIGFTVGAGGVTDLISHLLCVLHIAEQPPEMQFCYDQNNVPYDLKWRFSVPRRCVECLHLVTSSELAKSSLWHMVANDKLRIGF